MVKKLTSLFLTGLFAILPVGLSVYILVLFFKWVSTLSDRLFGWLVPQATLPGFGIVFGLLLILGVGALLHVPLFNHALQYLERPFKTLPLLKTVFQAIKDLMNYLKKDGESKSQPVLVCPPNSEIRIVGFLTQAQLPQDITVALGQKYRAVLIPMSYAIGGYTVMLPESWLKPIGMSFEAAMRSAITGWMTPPAKNDSKSD